MPTTPLQHPGQTASGRTPHSNNARSPVRQLRSLLHHPGTVATLWEPATHCAVVLGVAPSTVLSAPRTFSAAEPSTGMGATLERGPGLDQSKTPACRTLDALPRQHGGRNPQQGTPRRPQEPQGCRCDLREIRTSPRTTATPGAMLFSAPQCTFYSSHPLRTPDSGRRRRL